MAIRQLIINPGSTSTKLAIYVDRERQCQENIEHDATQIQAFESISEQIPFRLGVISDFLQRNAVALSDLNAIVGRGGILPGLLTGGYLVNEDLAFALASELASPHASNMGGILAKKLADQVGIPAFIYDAVTSSELPEVAKITGIPDIMRQSCCHVLNSRAMAIRYAAEHGCEYSDLNLIVAHLGGGISASVHAHGHIIDSVGDDDGQFSPERSGSVPSLELIKLCYSGKYTATEMQKKIRGRGGMYAHLGTSDGRIIERRIAEGDSYAEIVFHAQAYQVSKAIGLLSIVLKGKCDGIILTGGLAQSKILTERIKEYVSHIAPVTVMPGENEMEALALGGLRILEGSESSREYHLPTLP